MMIMMIMIIIIVVILPLLLLLLQLLLLLLLLLIIMITQIIKPQGAAGRGEVGRGHGRTARPAGPGRGPGSRSSSLISTLEDRSVDRDRSG